MSNIVHIDDAVSTSHLGSSVVDRVPPWLMAYQRCRGQQLHKRLSDWWRKKNAGTRARFGDVLLSSKHEIWVFWIVITWACLFWMVLLQANTKIDLTVQFNNASPQPDKEILSTIRGLQVVATPPLAEDLCIPTQDPLYEIEGRGQQGVDVLTKQRQARWRWDQEWNINTMFEFHSYLH